ncbi:DNA mismatch repair protein MutS [Elizabethkingia argentiflava]|uniref:DNA mismatch repair protein MutS n=1 Tax=Elizabethkingia argenteiflava TaxID=2681556 RepID=A0A845PVE2_9FLAO|nr:DNA mismatch repair protein MutS [Elizabethkingia argenteiflava]NAW52199.1 DNA mismatch repair protein MutS [Elizabethkingia argenteiflava]
MQEIENIIQNHQYLIDNTNKKRNIISFLRIFSFIASAVSLYKFLSTSLNVYFILFLISCIVFLLLIFISKKFQEVILYYQNIVQVCLGIKKEFCDQQPNMEHVDHHPYNKDLDIYGEKSLFSKINRTETFLGKQRLSYYLSHHLIECDQINERQMAIKELSSKMDWCIYFLAKAKLLDLDNFNKDVFEQTNNSFLKISAFTRVILYLISIVNLSLLTACIFTKFSPIILGITVLFISVSSLIVKLKYGKLIKNTYSNIHLRAAQYHEFKDLFSFIEKEVFQAKINHSYQEKLRKPSASISLKKIAQLIQNLENGHAPLLGVILNTIFLWNLHHSIKIDKLLSDLKSHIPDWFDTFSEFEALICFGIFAYKNKNYNYPICSENSPLLEIEKISHPLISSENSISNNFTIGNSNNIAIITGANMTGKSTFLRTIGVNLILAMNGCPLPAKKFIFRPMKVFTSMSSSDSLSDGTSYFNAEIKRLKHLLEYLENNIPLYIILDEILKGTNSKDKLEGSQLFLEKIISLNTAFSCIIATHDLELTNMVEDYPHHIINRCFELNEVQGKLEPDFKLKHGVTKTMNAIRLMKEYKIID